MENFSHTNAITDFTLKLNSSKVLKMIAVNLNIVHDEPY